VAHACAFALVTALVLPVGAAHAGAVNAIGPDFDGDGFADLAIGAPGDLYQRGSASVVHGGAQSYGLARMQVWSQNSAGVAGVAERGDGFGAALAAGDFDADGYDDLAIGAPGENSSAGAVNVLYGQADVGLSAAGNQLFTQDTPGIAGVARAHDEFGGALTVGDFDGDGYDDLAIDAGFDTVAGGARAGAVHVVFGGTNGLGVARSQHLDQNDAGVPSDGRTEEYFGWSLAAGDFDRDGRDDLAIGAPMDRVPGSGVVGGSVTVVRGSANGLTTSGIRYLWQSRAGMSDTSEHEDMFGWSVAAGDLDTDGYDDLAIGTPLEDANWFAPVIDAGLVHILYGGWNGIVTTGADRVSPWLNGPRDDMQPGDAFGVALLVADIGNNRAKLVVGSPYEDTSKPDAGQVMTFYAPGKAGTTTSGHTTYIGSDQHGYWGFALGSGDFDGSGRTNLAIGAPGAAVIRDGQNQVYSQFAGYVRVYTFGHNEISQGFMPELGDPRWYDYFGFALPAG